MTNDGTRTGPERLTTFGGMMAEYELYNPWRYKFSWEYEARRERYAPTPSPSVENEPLFDDYETVRLQ